MRRIAVFLIGFQFVLLIIPLPTSADDCSSVPGTHPATAADVPVMIQAGITGAVVGMCWNPNDKSVGADPGKAKQDLSSMRCDGSVNVEQLDAQFALCADKFMKTLRSQDRSACVRSGFRSAALQLSICQRMCGAPSCPKKCAAPGHSYHQKGLAIDVDHQINMNQFYADAAQAGLVNPTGLHHDDPNHIQPAGGSLNCSGVGFTPTDSDTFTPASPFSGMSNFIRQALGMQQQQSQPPASTGGQPAQQQQTGSPTSGGTPTGSSGGGQSSGGQQQAPAATQCVPSYSCTNGSYYYQTSSCTMLEVQKCPNGCDGDTCALPSAGSGGNPQNSGGSENPTRHATSAIDIIAAIGNPIPVDVGKPAPIALNPDIGNVKSELGDALSHQGTPAQNAPIALAPGSASQQTFTSSDLSNSPAPYQPQSTFALGILENMKRALIWALNYLQPFGGAMSSQNYAE